MSNLPIGSENDPNASWNETEGLECPVCNAPVDKEGPCSSICAKADLR